MAKRWTEKDDIYLHTFFDVAGDANIARDLDRPSGAPTKRAAFLKTSGAWKALTRMAKAQDDYRECVGHKTMDDAL